MEKFLETENSLVDSWTAHDRLRLMHALLRVDGRRVAVKKAHELLQKWYEQTGRARDVYHCTHVYFLIQMVDFAMKTDEAVAKKNAKSDQKKDEKEEEKRVELPSKAEFVAFLGRHPYLCDPVSGSG